MLTFVVERLAAGVQFPRAAVPEAPDVAVAEVRRLADGEHGHGVAVVAADHVQLLLLLLLAAVVVLLPAQVELEGATEGQQLGADLLEITNG